MNIEVKEIAPLKEAEIQAEVAQVGKITILPALLDVVCRTTGMGFAAVARVTDDRWIACSVKDDILFGLKPGGELKVETTICDEIRESRQAVVIDHVDEDKAYCGHPTAVMYGFQSYISVPIFRQDGRFFGTLCAIDPRPAKLSRPEVLEMFQLFTNLISFHLEAIEQVTDAESRLKEEKENALLREQFIAVLGHDLRNPVGAISSSASLLLRMPLEESARKVALIIKNSTYRISGLIDNVMDFARGRLGGGVSLTPKENAHIDQTLANIVAELQAIWTERKIETNFDLTMPVYCDAARIGQMFSNLLGNALAYGNQDLPVRVIANTTNDLFTLTVSNPGTKIPESTLERIFQPFSRAKRNGQQGLGLGLYIASAIAHAHKGKLTAQSNHRESTFSFSMPLNSLEGSL